MIGRERGDVDETSDLRIVSSLGNDGTSAQRVIGVQTSRFEEVLTDVDVVRGKIVLRVDES